MARILIVEDDRVTASFLEDVIKMNAKKYKYDSEYDIRFTVVDNAIDALKMLTIHSFELILTDILMAKMDGWEFITEVRKEHSRSDLPIIVVSAVRSADLKYEAVSKGATDGFAKPLRNKDLKRFITVIFNLILER